MSEDLKIYGYQNYYDQREIALFNFNNLVDKDSIKKSEVTSITDKGETEKFPLSNGNDWKPHSSYQEATHINNDDLDKSVLESYYKGINVPFNQNMTRIVLNRHIIITYTDFDDNRIVKTYTTENKIEYYREKYLKYKNKYIKLKYNK